MSVSTRRGVGESLTSRRVLAALPFHIVSEAVSFIFALLHGLALALSDSLRTVLFNLPGATFAKFHAVEIDLGDFRIPVSLSLGGISHCIVPVSWRTRCDSSYLFSHEYLRLVLLELAVLVGFPTEVA